MTHLLITMVIGCTTQPNEPVDDQALYNRCDAGDIEACYDLRGSDDDAARMVALSSACESAHKDSCELLYEWAKDRTESGSTSMALSAAMDGCRQGHPSLCKKALSFTDIDPDRAPVVEKHRAELEALLAEHTP